MALGCWWCKTWWSCMSAWECITAISASVNPSSSAHCKTCVYGSRMCANVGHSRSRWALLSCSPQKVQTPELSSTQCAFCASSWYAPEISRKSCLRWLSGKDFKMAKVSLLDKSGMENKLNLEVKCSTSYCCQAKLMKRWIVWKPSRTKWHLMTPSISKWPWQSKLHDSLFR